GRRELWECGDGVDREPIDRRAPPSPLAGEGWGGGYLFAYARAAPPSRFARIARETTSPTRGEVTGVNGEEKNQIYSSGLEPRSVCPASRSRLRSSRSRSTAQPRSSGSARG